MTKFQVNSNIATTGHKLQGQKTIYDNWDIELQMPKLGLCCSVKDIDIEQIVVDNY